MSTMISKDQLPDDIPEAFQIEDLLSLAQFKIYSGLRGDLKNPKGIAAVHPATDAEGKEPPFEFWMIATEYLMALTARKSGAGFEKALENLVQGAMTYKEAGKPPRSGVTEN